MKLISFNYRGVASVSKKYSLKRLIESNQLDLILLQEMMGESSEVTAMLEKLLKNWNFSSMDARDYSGGLASGWNHGTIKVANLWGFDSGMGHRLSQWTWA
jgi:exonuclease III